MTIGTEAFQQLKPCVSPGTHNFKVNSPPAGQFGYALIVCSRCGMTPQEARK
jgi:hypothetical protein